MFSLFTPAFPVSFSSLEKRSPFIVLHMACWYLQFSADWLADTCNSLLILNKRMFAGEISGSLSVSSQYFGGPYRDQWRPTNVPVLVNKEVWYLQLSSSSLFFSLTLELDHTSLSPWLKFTLSLHLKLSRLDLGSILKRFCLWLKPCSVCRYLCSTLVWFDNRHC